MKVIEDNWGSFPRTETCTKCKSKILIENRTECEYRPYKETHFFEQKESFVWECPCCHERNFIYV